MFVYFFCFHHVKTLIDVCYIFVKPSSDQIMFSYLSSYVQFFSFDHYRVYPRSMFLLIDSCLRFWNEIKNINIWVSEMLCFHFGKINWIAQKISRITTMVIWNKISEHMNQSSFVWIKKQTFIHALFVWINGVMYKRYDTITNQQSKSPFQILILNPIPQSQIQIINPNPQS